MLLIPIIILFLSPLALAFTHPSHTGSLSNQELPNLPSSQLFTEKPSREEPFDTNDKAEEKCKSTPPQVYIRHRDNRVGSPFGLIHEDGWPIPIVMSLVPLSENSVEFAAGLTFGLAGCAIGGPKLGILASLTANYVARTNEGEAAVFVQGVSTKTIQVYNFFAKINSKYEVLDNVKKSLEMSLENLKQRSGVNPDTVEVVQEGLVSLEKTTGKAVEATKAALGVVGDIVEQGINGAKNLNDEYKLTDRAVSLVKDAAQLSKSSSQQKFF